MFSPPDYADGSFSIFDARLEQFWIMPGILIDL
jgi:hypothetical protein